MNSLGLGILFNMGCTCTKESVCINGKRYVVKSRLGEGGFSVVDLVYDANSQRLYALKRIPCHTRESERDAMREAELYKSFDHPNLVRCVDAALVPCHDLSKPFSSEVLILLPYFRRGTLQDELTMRARSRDHMPEPRLLEIFTGMCQGVQAIHSATPIALAHRDLKPANVLLADDDMPVWMDFGSMGRARLDIGRTSEAMALQDLATEKCSMSYRAPELFNVESRTSIDERVDIWKAALKATSRTDGSSPWAAACMPCASSGPHSIQPMNGATVWPWLCSVDMLTFLQTVPTLGDFTDLSVQCWRWTACRGLSLRASWSRSQLSLPLQTTECDLQAACHLKDASHIKSTRLPPFLQALLVKTGTAELSVWNIPCVQ